MEKYISNYDILDKIAASSEEMKRRWSGLAYSGEESLTVVESRVRGQGIGLAELTVVRSR